ncbi:MAG TPA: retroviral-like aspartic protease family protein [Allosphingosinicella sp.]|jgi:tetratricopeptide (TPR) repeat protein/predicted aspartyl protease|nr:retroviral-like aspartic protease family protein [Allosphingosinicella sp.]
MRRNLCRALAAFAALAFGAGAAQAECKLEMRFNLPVTMSRLRPLVEAKINGVPGQFIVDSGAFYSMLSPGMAGAAKVQLNPAPPWFRITGIGGSTTTYYTTVKNLGLAGQQIPHMDFYVGGSDTGVAGLLGQNVLGIGDVEYDLPDGYIRLWRWRDCRDAAKAYWANGNYSLLKIDERSERNPHTTATVQVNGNSFHAVFDTGASSTTMSLRAAARLGLKPDSPGVHPAGYSSGLGRRVVQVWSIPVSTIDIGGEEIHNARIMMQDLGDDTTDMLIGADFFISHRVYVDNGSRRMFFTYTGGELFHQKATAGADAPLSTASTGESNEPKDAEGFSRRGAVFLSEHDVTRALADFSKAIDLAPKEPRYYVQRAQAHQQNRQPFLALADFDKAIALDPANVPALLARAQLSIARGAREEAVPDLDAAARALAPTADERLRVGQLYSAASAYGPAIGEYDQWIRVHGEDRRLPEALNGRCWARALTNQDLPRALDDCNKALSLSRNNPSFLDSRGLVRLRMGDWDRAIADYDAALKAEPKLAWSLYGRGLARRHKGLAKEADADIAAAVAIAPELPERAKKFGIS